METSTTTGLVFASPYRTTGYVGPYTYFNGPVEIIEGNEGAHVHIGRFCSVAKGLKLFLGNNHRTDWVSTFPFPHTHPELFPSVADQVGHPSTNGDIVIGNDVWIGDSATIMSGVTVGDGAVISANAHVVKDVEPYSIVGGNPARFIRHRFTAEQREALLRLRWWYFDIAQINALAPLLMSDEIDPFIAAAEALKREADAAAAPEVRTA
jgi:acetyltransferase-like isoleucine patch superfamily enzyme